MNDLLGPSGRRQHVRGCASPFIHHFEPNAVFGPASTDLLERIENQELSGVTTTQIISEVAHRLMTIEAMQAFGWKSAGIALKLRNHPAQVQTLKRFRQAVQEIPLFSVRVLTIDRVGWTWPHPSANKPATCTTTLRSSRSCAPMASTTLQVPTPTSTACRGSSAMRLRDASGRKNTTQLDSPIRVALSVAYRFFSGASVLFWAAYALAVPPIPATRFAGLGFKPISTDPLPAEPGPATSFLPCRSTTSSSRTRHIG